MFACGGLEIPTTRLASAALWDSDFWLYLALRYEECSKYPPDTLFDQLGFNLTVRRSLDSARDLKEPLQLDSESLTDSASHFGGQTRPVLQE